MTTLIACPGCKHHLTLPSEVIGQRVRCPRCEVDFEAQLEAKIAPTASTSAAGEFSASAPHRSNPAPMIFCMECGTRFLRSDHACPGCGLSLERMLGQFPQGSRSGDMPPVNTWLPVVGALLVATGFALSVFIVLFAILARRNGGFVAAAAWVFFTLATAAFLAAAVCCLIWMYQAWRVVANEEDDVSPGLKIGLLFVPFFNLYWMFQVIPALSGAIGDDLRKFAPTRTYNTGRVLGRIACILMLIPDLQPLAVCMFIAWMLIANSALQRLIRYHERLEAIGDSPMDVGSSMSESQN